MFENPRRGRQARNFTTNAPKILDLKSSSEQIFFLKLSLGAPAYSAVIKLVKRHHEPPVLLYFNCFPGWLAWFSLQMFFLNNKIHFSLANGNNSARFKTDPQAQTPSSIFSCWDGTESNFVSCKPIKVPNGRCILTLSLHLIAGELTSDRLYSSLRRTFGRHDNRKIIFVLNLVAGLSLIQTICRLFQNIFSGFPFNIPLLASL